MLKYALPPGFTARPAAIDDLPALAGMLNRCSVALHGVEEHSVEDLRSYLSSPGLHMEEDTLLALAPDGEIAGYYYIWDPCDPHTSIYIWGQTDPNYANQGIGSCLLEWAEQRARRSVMKAPPGARVTALCYVNTIQQSATELFCAAGFEIARYSLRMRVDFDAPPPTPALPEGIVIRPMQVGRDERTIALASRESFRDHWGFVERPLEDDVAEWMHRFQTDPFLNPNLYFIAWDGDQVAGIALCYNGYYDDHNLGWVSTLGVLRPWRRRGLGQALLQHSFCELYAMGRRRMGLEVDAASLTGATRLYERVGMRSDPRHQMARFEKELRPGIDLSTQSLA